MQLVSQSDLSSSAFILERTPFHCLPICKASQSCVLFSEYLQQDLAIFQCKLQSRLKSRIPLVVSISMQQWFGHHGVQYVTVLLVSRSRPQQSTVGTRIHSDFLNPKCWARGFLYILDRFCIQNPSFICHKQYLTPPRVESSLCMVHFCLPSNLQSIKASCLFLRIPAITSGEVVDVPNYNLWCSF